MKQRILVVDDDEVMAQAISDMLGTLGFETAIALDGINASVRIKQRKPDLIVMDFKMPGGSGDLVSERLQLSTETRDIPIIFVSARPLAEVRKAIPRLRNVAFLSKPVDAEQLKAQIAALLKAPS